MTQLVACFLHRLQVPIIWEYSPFFMTRYPNNRQIISKVLTDLEIQILVLHFLAMQLARYICPSSSWNTISFLVLFREVLNLCFVISKWRWLWHCCCRSHQNVEFLCWHLTHFIPDVNCGVFIRSRRICTPFAFDEWPISVPTVGFVSTNNCCVMINNSENDRLMKLN